MRINYVEEDKGPKTYTFDQMEHEVFYKENTPLNLGNCYLWLRVKSAYGLPCQWIQIGVGDERRASAMSIYKKEDMVRGRQIQVHRVDKDIILKFQIEEVV